MGFIEGKCIKCQGILQIPEEREYIICMYCGEELSVSEAVANQDSISAYNKQVSKDAARENYEEHMTFALASLPEVLVSLDEPMKQFSKKQYARAFDETYLAHRELFSSIDKVWLFAEEPDEAADQLAKAVADRALTMIEQEPKKRQKEEKLTALNMAMVVYVFPMILKYNGEYSEPLTDKMLEHWKQAFPKTNLSKATFEAINGGFKRRLCYITTAVCEGIGKADDCYELRTLRNYRDQYLSREPEGRAVIQEYYNIAPTIVKRIGKQRDAHDIYAHIWQDYLEPCIRDIENENPESCKERYVKMVRDLQGKYVYH